MKTSTDRILTTHTGSLPRPKPLIDIILGREKQGSVDAAAFEAATAQAVDQAVAQQVAAGIDVVNDGEMSKPSYTTYIRHRVGGIAPAAGEGEPAHRADRRQRLAAEAEGHDRRQIAVGDFRSRVPLDGKGEIGFVHAMPVVDDPDQPAPAGLDRDLDRFRPGVERVLDQFLDRRRRPLDHLARGDAVDG